MDSPQSDPQREQLYFLEAEEFGRHCWHRARRKDLRTWLREMTKLLGVKAPKLRFGDCGSRYGAEYDSNTQTIKMSHKGGPCLLLLCHEFAHHVEFTQRPGRPDHGPYFCLTYMTLLDRMRLVPEEGFRAAARRHGVKIARQPGSAEPVRRRQRSPEKPSA
jgi:hypothetical protein